MSVNTKCFFPFVFSTFCELSTLFYRVNVGNSETCSHLTINNKPEGYKKWVGQLDKVRNQKLTTSMSYSKCICLIWSIIADPKKGNVERHFGTVHKNCDTDFPQKSKLRRRKGRELKSQLIGQQSFFTQWNSQANTATEASLWVKSSDYKRGLCWGSWLLVYGF